MLQKNDDWLSTVTGYGKVTCEPLEWLALEFLCFNMREIDREEIYDNQQIDNPIGLAAALHHAIARNGCAWIARLNGRPAACLGVFENFPGNWQVFSFGTPDYRRTLVAFKPKLDNMLGFARARGMHRLECRSLAHHRDAHRITRFIGMKPEATLRAFGRARQDYIVFARVFEA